MLRSALIYLPSYLFPRLATFLIVVVGARLLGPEQFGYFSLVVVIGEFADMAVTNWIRIALTRFGARSGGVSRSFAGRMGGLVCICTLAALALACAVAAWLAPEKISSMIAAVGSYILSAASVRFGITLHQAQQSHKRASLFESGRALAVFLASVGAMVATREFLPASLAASAVNLAIGLTTVARGLRMANRSLLDDTPLKTIVSFALPLIAIAILSQAISSLDKALLKAFHDARTLGLYAVAFAVGRTGFDVIAGAFNTGTFVRLSMLFNEGKKTQAQDVLSQQIAYLLSIALPAAGILIASRDVLARVLFPPAYLETFVVAVPLVAAGAIMFNLKNFVYDNIFHMHLRNLRQIPTLIAGAAVSAGFGLWLVPSHPQLGAAAMFAGGSATALAMSITLTSSLMRVHFPWRTLVVAAILGLCAWGAGEGLKAALTDKVPDAITLGLLACVGALITGGSLVATLASTQDKDLPATVLHVISSLSMGGAEKMLCDILEVGARRNCFRYHVLVINNVADVQLLGRLKASNVGVHLLRRPPASRNPFYLLKSIRLMLVVRPRIVHCHGIHPLFWSLCASCFPGRRMRFLLTVHYAGISRLARFNHWLVSAFADQIVAISQAVKLDCCKAGFARARCIYNGIDLAVYDLVTTPGGRKENEYSIITVGRLSSEPTTPAEKGHDLLIEALALCRSCGISVRAKFVGPESGFEPGARAKLEALARKLDVADSIEFTGNRNDVPALLKAADVFVLASRNEAFGLALVEAMAAGLPVVASDVGSPREILRDGKDGLMFRSGDAHSLAEALVRLFRDSTLRQQLASRALTRAQDFSIEKTVAGYEALYRQVA